MNLSIEKYLEDERGEEFLVEYTAEVGNNGIGSYEFWGQRCFDKGQATIEDVSFNEEGLTQEQIQLAQNRIDNGSIDEACWDKLADLSN